MSRAKPILAAAIILLALAVSYFLVTGLLSGAKTPMALAGVMAVAPLATYFAIRKPLFFPFFLYVAFVPFDELLVLSRFVTLTRILAILSGAAIAFWLIRFKKLNQPPRSLLVWSLLFVWMLLSVFWAINPDLALSRITSFLQLFVLYGIICLVPATIDDLKAIVAASAIGGTIGAAYGAYYFHENINKIMRLLLSNGQNVTDPNHFGASLILPIAIVTVFALSARSILIKTLLIAVDFVLFAGVYLTGSRGSFIALAVVLLYLLWASRQRLQLAILSALALGASFLMPASIWTRFATALSSGGAGRLYIWHIGYGAFKQHWLFGAGIENFPLAFNQAFFQVYSPHGIGWGRAAHNLIVEYGVELGIIGLLLMLAAWATQFSILNQIDKNSSLYNYRMIAQSAILGLFSAAMFLDVVNRKYTWLVFMLASLTYSAWKIQQRPRARHAIGPIELTQPHLELDGTPPVAVRTGQHFK